MVDLWAMSAQMCTQSFVALCCVQKKPWGFLDLQRTDNNNKNNSKNGFMIFNPSNS